MIEKIQQKSKRKGMKKFKKFMNKNVKSKDNKIRKQKPLIFSLNLLKGFPLKIVQYINRGTDFLSRVVSNFLFFFLRKDLFPLCVRNTFHDMIC